MRLIALLFVCQMLLLPLNSTFAAAAKDGASASSEAEALFKKAEEMEWGNAGGSTKEIDQAYEKAALAGNPYAILYITHIKKFYAAEKNEEELKNVWCPKAREFVEVCEKDQKIKGSETPYQLALYYSNGACVPRDRAKSLGYAMMAARNGSAKAMGNFGKIERSFLKNPEAAFTWFEKAANADSLLGKVYLAGCYFGGLGVAKDDKKANEIADQVAASNNMNAIHMMALKFLDGEDSFPKDEARGRALLEKAAANGHDLAIMDLKDLKK